MHPWIFAAKVSRTAVIPAELLRVLPGQPFRGVLSSEGTTRMLQLTTHRPEDRLGKIVDMSREALHNNRVTLDLTPQMTPVTLLQPPQLNAGGGQSVRPAKLRVFL